MIYMSRDYPITSPNVWTRLADEYGTAKADIIVPSGVSAIKQLIWACTGGALSKPSAMGLKLSGNGLREGDQEFKGFHHVSGAGTVTDSDVINPYTQDIDIPVTPGNTITIYGAMSGADADAGSPEFSTTLGFA